MIMYITTHFRNACSILTFSWNPFKVELHFVLKPRRLSVGSTKSPWVQFSPLYTDVSRYLTTLTASVMDQCVQRSICNSTFCVDSSKSLVPDTPIKLCIIRFISCHHWGLDFTNMKLNQKKAMNMQKIEMHITFN